VNEECKASWKEGRQNPSNFYQITRKSKEKKKRKNAVDRNPNPKKLTVVEKGKDFQSGVHVEREKGQ